MPDPVREPSRAAAGAPLLHWIATAFALAGGLAIAWIDTRPHWDDAGITAGLVLLTAGLTAATGARPWLVPVLVAGPMVAAEVGGGLGVLLAVPFAIAGSFAGWGARRLAAGAARATGW